MAGTTIIATREGIRPGVTEESRLALNKLVDDVESLRAALDTVADQLDSDAGVTDTDYAANAAVATAATMVAPKVGAEDGSTT